MPINQSFPHLGVLICSLVFLGSVCALPASGATYYLSPTGADTNAGTTATSPWKTFKSAIPKLKPGDTLRLLNGTYTSANSGYLSINCNSNASNGTATQPITINATTERRALLSGNGIRPALQVFNCSYWTIHGLQFRGADASGSSNGSVLDIRNSTNLTFRRLLIRRSNRYTNESLVYMDAVRSSLFEENEFYSFHRHAINTKYGSGTVFRRNYFNSRAYPDLSGGVDSASPSRGEAAITIYPGSNHLAENNISEGNMTFMDLEASGTTSYNRFFGNISLNDIYGILVKARGSGLSYMPRDTVMTNFVAITPTWYGLYARSGKNTRCNNCSVFGGRKGINADRSTSYPGDGAYSTFSNNTLVLRSTTGFQFSNQSAWLVDYPNVYQAQTSFSPYDSHIIHERMIDPQLGSCKVFIPAGSPLKGAGKTGADIGANVLYRYHNGTLTTQPLWAPSTGKFPCGAIVAGVNDVAGASCIDVHKRLNVNTNGCMLPSNYGQSSLSVAAPSNLQILALP